MPEGHKTHFIAREHTALLAGQSVKVISPQGRFRSDARKVSGQILDHVEAVGKHLFYHFESGRLVHIHLGRYGKFRQHGIPVPAPVGKVRVRMIGQDAAIDLNGPTTCRVIDSNLRAEVIGKLGPDPLAGGRKVDVWKKVTTSKKTIGALLLDQSVVAGVGNIFRAEVLFDIGMDPTTRGCELQRGDFDQLWRSLTKMMRMGLKHGKIITVTARQAGKPLETLSSNERLRVYRHDACPNCQEPIETMELAARKLYYCPACQDGACQ